jgi:hypothetical protein
VTSARSFIASAADMMTMMCRCVCCAPFVAGGGSVC